MPNLFCPLQKDSEFWLSTNKIISAWIHKAGFFVICYFFVNTVSACLDPFIYSTTYDCMRSLELWSNKMDFKAFYPYHISIFLNHNYLLSAPLKLLITQPVQFSPHTSQQDYLHHPANHQLPLPQLSLRNDLLPISGRFLWLTFSSIN